MIETKNNILIAKIINSLTQENDHLMDQLLQIQYWFRGAISREDVFQMNAYEREKAIEFINKRFKEAGDFMKKQIPVFL